MENQKELEKILSKRLAVGSVRKDLVGALKWKCRKLKCWRCYVVWKIKDPYNQVKCLNY